jgi:enoyl-CoA hydratase/carnithine racemase
MALEAAARRMPSGGVPWPAGLGGADMNAEPKASGLSLTVADGVATVTIAYPPFNLVGGPLFVDLAALLDRFVADDSIRVVVLQSGIPGVFCLHGDVLLVESLVEQLQHGGADALLARSAPAHALLDRLAGLPQITIAKIAGLCRGGGLEFALACDMRFAAEGITRIGQPETALGIIPGGGGLTRLPRLIGAARALEVIVGTADLSAADAERLGLINRAVAPEGLDAHVGALARHIADLPAYAVAAAKRAVQAAVGPLDYGPEVEAFATTMGHADTPRLLRGMLAAGMQRSLEDELDFDALTAEGRRLARLGERG